MFTSSDLLSHSQNSLVATEPPLPFNGSAEMAHSVAGRSLTPIQAQISNVLLRHVLQHEPAESEWYTIGMSELHHLLQFDSRDYTPLLTAALALQRIRCEWNAQLSAKNRRALMEGKIGTDNRTLLRTSMLFPELEVSVKTLRYQVSRPVVEHLLKLEMNAPLDPGVINRLHMTAGIVIFEHTPRGSKLGRTR